MASEEVVQRCERTTRGRGGGGGASEERFKGMNGRRTDGRTTDGE